MYAGMCEGERCDRMFVYVWMTMCALVTCVTAMWKVVGVWGWWSLTYGSRQLRVNSVCVYMVAMLCRFKNVQCWWTGYSCGGHECLTPAWAQTWLVSMRPQFSAAFCLSHVTA
jgi:hypothetical protein